MYLDKEKYRGDHISAAEELLASIPQLEQSCKIINKVVKEGDFTLQEALHIYKVSEIDYFTYWVLKNNKKLNRTKKQDQILETIFLIVSIIGASSTDLNEIGNKIKSYSPSNSNIFSRKNNKNTLQLTSP